MQASNFNKSQQLSTSRSQQVQHQSLRNNKFQQDSISAGIWFGTRGSEVQILSPRPLFSMSVPETWVTERSGDIGYTFGPKGFSKGLTLRKLLVRSCCSRLDACQDCFFSVSQQDIDRPKARIREQANPLHRRQSVSDAIVIFRRSAEEAVIVAY